MRTVSLTVPEGYAPETSPRIAQAAAQLDALLASLTGRIRSAAQGELEWQPVPGVNTIGMLMAHVALSELYWVEMVPAGIESEPEIDRISLEILGISMADDGQIPEGATHPPALAGKSAADYLEILHKARSATHRVLRQWTDGELDEPLRLDDERQVTRSWLLHHVIDHFAQHLGQIALLASLRRRMGAE